MKIKTAGKPKEMLDSKNELRLVYKIDYFYDRFIKKHKYIDTLEGKFKKDKVLTFAQYKLIIKTYLKIYFYEVFYIDKPLYCFLTGKLIRVRSTAFTISWSNAKIKPTITVIWYLKLLNTMDSHCMFKLLRGASILSKMRTQWTKENDLGMLPMIITKRKEIIDNNLMYHYNDKRTIFFQPNPRRRYPGNGTDQPAQPHP